MSHYPRGIADKEANAGLSDTQIEVLAITACRENHLSGERMCAQCFAIERAILKALKLQGEIINQGGINEQEENENH